MDGLRAPVTYDRVTPDRPLDAGLKDGSVQVGQSAPSLAFQAPWPSPQGKEPRYHKIGQISEGGWWCLWSTKPPTARALSPRSLFRKSKCGKLCSTAANGCRVNGARMCYEKQRLQTQASELTMVHSGSGNMSFELIDKRPQMLDGVQVRELRQPSPCFLSKGAGVLQLHKGTLANSLTPPQLPNQ